MQLALLLTPLSCWGSSFAAPSPALIPPLIGSYKHSPGLKYLSVADPFLSPSSHIRVSRRGPSAPALWGCPQLPPPPGAGSAGSSSHLRRLQARPVFPVPALGPIPVSGSRHLPQVPRAPRARGSLGRHMTLRVGLLCRGPQSKVARSPPCHLGLQVMCLCPPLEHDPVRAGLPPCCQLTDIVGTLQWPPAKIAADSSPTSVHALCHMTSFSQCTNGGLATWYLGLSLVTTFGQQDNSKCDVGRGLPSSGHLKA